MNGLPKRYLRVHSPRLRWKTFWPLRLILTAKGTAMGVTKTHISSISGISHLSLHLITKYLNTKSWNIPRIKMVFEQFANFQRNTIFKNLACVVLVSHDEEDKSDPWSVFDYQHKNLPQTLPAVLPSPGKHPERKTPQWKTSLQFHLLAPGWRSLTENNRVSGPAPHSAISQMHR